MLRPVLQYPDPRLAQKAEAVEEITDEIRELAQDLMDTLTTIGGEAYMTIVNGEIVYQAER